MTFSQLRDRHIGLSFRKQLALADFLGKHSWQLDLGKGTVDFGKAPGLFGKKRIYPIQLVGTEAEDAGTWLWAWGNEASNLPPGVLRSVNDVRALGESQGIDALVTAELPSSDYPGHLLASIAAGVADADGYYRGPYPGGAAFFLIFETPLRQAPPPPIERLTSVLMQVISEFDVNHRDMARAYLESEGFRLEDRGARIAAVDGAGRTLNVAFDDRDRIAGIETEIRGG